MSSNDTDTGDTQTTHSRDILKIGTATTPAEKEAGVGTPPKDPSPREALVTTAVNFLHNPKVYNATLLQKQQFLRSKGLTNTEIQMAYERAGIFSQDPDSKAPTVINMDINTTRAQLALQPQQTTMLDRLKELLHSMALLGGVAYAFYTLWKKFLEPFLFGKSKKKRTADETLSDINMKIDVRISEVRTELNQVKETIAREQRDQTQKFMREFNNFKTDLEAIKGLLLNRKQFAAPLNIATLGTPSIPTWQLSSSSPHHSRHHINSQSDDNEKADDVGSGSGSSETEVVTKNSDSSLEIM
uniref:Peroxisomal membrane protein PEX14 n=2 Tax=Glossina morsitans morsitans TaxID=37546 RepID=A0A1B0GCN6_GLOMM